MKKPAIASSAEQELQQLQDRLSPIFKRYHILKAIVFGSFARGEVTSRSDLDLILVQQTKKRFLDHYEGILFELGNAVGSRDVEVFIYTPEELGAMSERAFIATAMREGKVIYESCKEPI